MYYYGNNGYYQPGTYSYAGYTQGCCSNGGAAIWIVLFILLVIIIGAGLNFGPGSNNNCNNGCNI